MSGEKDLDRYSFLVDLIAEEYLLLLFEDKVAAEISKIRSEISNEVGQILNYVKHEYGTNTYRHLMRELLWFIYTDHVVEPVRLGVYRTLFFEAYRVVHGKLDFFSLTTHGLIRERLGISRIIRNTLAKNKEIHTGIDLAIVFEYPSSINPRKKIAVPLFIIGKYRKDSVKEIRLREAIRIALSDQTLKDKKTRLALKHIDKFAIVSLLRTIDKPEELNNGKCLLELRELGEDVQRHLQDIPVYSDFVCSIVYPVFKKIPEFYNIIDNNEKLAELTTHDWVNALIQLAVPLINIVLPSSSAPPSSPGGGLALKITQRIRSAIMNKLNKTPITIKAEKTIANTRYRIISRFKKQLNSILEEVRRKNEKENRRMLLHSA